ncbi:hypothetical protein D9M72_317180 [compost metagenome]
MLGEAVGRDHHDLTFLDVGIADQAAHAAVVVDVRVAVHHGLDRFLAKVFADQVEGGLRGLAGYQRVEHDPAGIALHEGDVGQVIAAHLVDAVRHLEQPVLHVELGIAPQAGIDRVRGRLVQADVLLVLLHVPHGLARSVLDGELVGPCNQAALRVVEVRPVREGQGPEDLGIGAPRGLRGWLRGGRRARRGAGGRRRTGRWCGARAWLGGRAAAGGQHEQARRGYGHQSCLHRISLLPVLPMP